VSIIRIDEFRVGLVERGHLGVAKGRVCGDAALLIDRNALHALLCRTGDETGFEYLVVSNHNVARLPRVFTHLLSPLYCHMLSVRI
jgi:hypothetical protein